MHSAESQLDGDQSPGDAPTTAVATEFIRWRTGDPAALERLVRRFSGALWHIARAYGLDAAAAEDAVQLTWLTFIQHADGIREPAAVPGWLTTTVRREAAHLARARSREVIRADDDRPERPAPGEPSMEEVVVASLEARTLWRHVSRLSERCQRLLRVIAFCRYLDHAALSAQLGVPVASLGTTRRRCLDELRASLAADPTWSTR